MYQTCTCMRQAGSRVSTAMRARRGGRMLALAALGAPAAGAVGPGLPRGYDVERVDRPLGGSVRHVRLRRRQRGSPQVRRRGRLLTGQGTRILNDGTGAENGEVVVVSGETGDIICTISAPEPDAGCSTAGTATDRCAAFGFYITPIGRNATSPRRALSD